MKGNEVCRRIVFSQEVSGLLEREVNNLKNKGRHFKVNEAKLASAAIELFFEELTEKVRERLEARFFNRKLYLKDLIEGSETEEDLSSSLSEFLKKSKPTTATQRSKKELKSATDTDLKGNKISELQMTDTE